MSKQDNKSQFDMGMTLKKAHQDQIQALRVVEIRNYVSDWYSRVVPVYDLNGSVISAKFYQDNTRPSYKVSFIGNSANILLGKYFTINTGGNRKKFYVWFDDSTNSAIDPMIAGRVGIRIEIENGDSAAIVAFAVASALKLTHEFSATTNGYTPILEISSVEKGYADPMLAGDSGFTVDVLTVGYSNLIKELTLTPVPDARYVYNELESRFELMDTAPIAVTLDFLSYTAQVVNFNIVNANQEYSITLPDSTRKFSLKLRETDADLQVYFASASPEYFTVRRGVSYREDQLETTSVTIYFKSNKPSKTLELVYWL